MTDNILLPLDDIGSSTGTFIRISMSNQGRVSMINCFFVEVINLRNCSFWGSGELSME